SSRFVCRTMLNNRYHRTALRKAKNPRKLPLLTTGHRQFASLIAESKRVTSGLKRRLTVTPLAVFDPAIRQTVLRTKLLRADTEHALRVRFCIHGTFQRVERSDLWRGCRTRAF